LCFLNHNPPLQVKWSVPNGVYLLTNSNDQMATIAQLHTDRKHKNYVQIKITHNNIMTHRRIYGYQTTRLADNSDRDKSARILRQLGPSIIIVVLLIFLIKLTEIIKIQSDICQVKWSVPNGVYLLTNSNDQMATIAQLHTDRKHKDTVWHLSTVLGNVKKKNPYIINQNHIYFKNYCELIFCLFAQIFIWLVFICT
jgi:hypothetical protein